MNKIITSFKDSWQGREKLWVVFWLWNMLLGSVMGVIDWKTQERPIAFDLAYLLLLLAYTVFICVTLWRCAFNVTWKGWGYASRAMVGVLALVAAAIVYTIVGYVIWYGAWMLGWQRSH